MEIDFFKAEHAVLLDLRARLMTALDGAPNAPFAATLRGALDRILVGHLAKEDAHLYPHLKRTPRTAAIAERFERELGGLARAWGDFMADWPGERIAADWAGFGAAARPVLNALADRVTREEADLYPLLLISRQDAA